MTPIAKASKSLQPHCHWMPVYLLSSPNCKQRAASTSPFVESIYSNTIIYIQFLAFPLVYDDIIVTYYLMCTRAVIVCALILGRKYRKYSLPLQTPHWCHKMQGPHNLIAIHRSENTTGHPVLSYIGWYHATVNTSTSMKWCSWTLNLDHTPV